MSVVYDHKIKGLVAQLPDAAIEEIAREMCARYGGDSGTRKITQILIQQEPAVEDRTRQARQLALLAAIWILSGSLLILGCYKLIELILRWI